jgi:hypothetical protein
MGLPSMVTFGVPGPVTVTVNQGRRGGMLAISALASASALCHGGGASGATPSRMIWL